MNISKNQSMDWSRYLAFALLSLVLSLSNLSSLLWGADLFGKPNCEEIAATIEKEANLPKYLLSSISRVEAGRKLSNGEVRGWPWALNHAGKGMFFESKDAALKYLKQAVESGSRNIDVGCMQLNYRWHKMAFSSIEEMIDPELNVRYAAQFVTELYQRHNAWEDVIKHYHSNKEKFNIPYFRKVSKVWDMKKDEAEDSNPLMFTEAEQLEPLIDLGEDKVLSVEPLVVFDAASYPGADSQLQTENIAGINFTSGDPNNSSSRIAPIDVPNYLRKHWSLVISLREQLETN